MGGTIPWEGGLGLYKKQAELGVSQQAAFFHDFFFCFKFWLEFLPSLLSVMECDLLDI